MPLNKIYLYLPNEDHKIAPRAGEASSVADEQKLDFFLLDIYRNTGYEVGIYRGALQELPEDMLLVIYFEFGEYFSELMMDLPNEILRRIFLIGGFYSVTREKLDKKPLAGMMKSVMYELFAYRFEPINGREIEEGTYFEGNVHALQPLYNRVGWENTQREAYGVWVFRDGIVEELCVYLKEYCQKFDMIKEIDPFDSNEDGSS